MTGGFDRLNHRDSMTGSTTAMLGLAQPPQRLGWPNHRDSMTGSTTSALWLVQTYSTFIFSDGNRALIDV
jgi:hypothetical protein